ncbi:MAG: hypothetical protein ACF8QF_12385 [Phycisphaerales bacterium]
MEQTTPTDQPASRPEVEVTSLNKGWLIKLTVIGVALLGLGVWGLYDALAAFPARGANHAEFTEWRYLQAANEAGRLLTASEDAPGDELTRLRNERNQLRERLGDTPEGTIGYREISMDLAKYDWLTSLSRIGRVNAEYTTFDNPRERLDTLTQEWDTRTQPKPLAAYDIPSQWVFVVCGFGGFAWISLIILRAKGIRYSYKPASLELTLPSGRSFTPDQIAEVDKRKWHKFYVTLRFKQGAGEAVTLDLLRHKPLEDWILEMEKQTDGYEPPAEDEDATAPEREGSGPAMAGEHMPEGEPKEPHA